MTVSIAHRIQAKIIARITYGYTANLGTAVEAKIIDRNTCIADVQPGNLKRDNSAWTF